MQELVVRFIDWLEDTARSLRLRFDRCHICSQEGCYWCEGCRRRHCVDHESFFYNDCDYCTECRAAITPDDEAEMLKDAIAADCESGCHAPECPCTRPHTEHTEECAGCQCQQSGPCDTHCKPSGFTYEVA
jgi:hypothetical protein